MSWQPIETAPTDVLVRLGFWADYGGELVWRTEAGIAWRSRSIFGLWKWRERGDWSNYATHWKLPPEPPE